MVRKRSITDDRLALCFRELYTSHEKMTLKSYPEYSAANYFLSRKNY